MYSVIWKRSNLRHEEAFQSVATKQVHAPDNAAHDVRPHILHLRRYLHRDGVIGHVQNLQNQPVQLIHVLILVPVLLVPPALLFGGVGSTPCGGVPLLLRTALGLALALTPASRAQVVQHGFGLAAVHHLLQALVFQLVAFEVDLLQFGAVSQLKRQLGQLVAGQVQNLWVTGYDHRIGLSQQKTRLLALFH